MVTVLQCYASLHLLLIEWQFLFTVGYPGNLDSKWKMLVVKEFRIYCWEVATNLRNNLLLDSESYLLFLSAFLPVFLSACLSLCLSFLLKTSKWILTSIQDFSCHGSWNPKSHWHPDRSRSVTTGDLRSKVWNYWHTFWWTNIPVVTFMSRIYSTWKISN